jgi:hypothetical protein
MCCEHQVAVVVLGDVPLDVVRGILQALDPLYCALRQQHVSAGEVSCALQAPTFSFTCRTPHIGCASFTLAAQAAAYASSTGCSLLDVLWGS